MIVVPFLFFSALTFYWWHRHRSLDPSVYMAAFYALISLMAIVIVAFDMTGDGGILVERGDTDFGLIPTLLFCATIGLCLLPFSMIYTRDIKKLTINAPWAVDLGSLMLIAVSFLNLYLVADSTMDILQGDLGQVRDDHYSGVDSPAQLKAETLSYVLRVFYYLNASTILCIPIFFYNLCFGRKPWWWNALLLFASLSSPIVGIQVADRTEIVCWGQMLLFSALFFFRFMSKKLRWKLALSSVPIVVLALAYLVMVSQSRFDRNGASDSGSRTFQYAGQGYLNFCYFYENANTDYISTERVFPFINHFVLHRDSNADRRVERSGEQGFFISVFPTFVGDLLLDLGLVGMIAWVTTYFLVVMLFLRRSHRDEFDISEVLIIYLLALVPVFGIFYYRLFYFTNTITIVLTVMLYFLSRYKFTLK